MALSTGWLPPDPKPMLGNGKSGLITCHCHGIFYLIRCPTYKAQNVAIATKSGDPAPINPATPEMASVMLKAVRLPIISAVMGQKDDPSTRPTYLATMIIEMRWTANSRCTGGLMIVIACIQNWET